MFFRPAFSFVSLTVLLAAAPAAAQDAPTRETICDDGIDNDGDGLTDCADADCASAPNCIPDGKPENTAARCSDWVDNDRDGSVDCDDLECQNLAVCQGSWKGPLDGDGGSGGGGGGGAAGVEAPDGTPRYQGGTVEQPDSEGGLGFTGVRFGVVAGARQSFISTNDVQPDDYRNRLDTRFDTLQLRAFGNLPFLEDSFFLLSMQAAQSPRVTFAFFQFPLGNGHYIALNTGGSTLSAQPLVSVAKRPLLDLPRYLLRPFDQFLDAGLEVHGPLVLNLLRYRAFVGGGTGLFGDFGGRRFDDATINPTYSAGAQLWVTPVGIYNRFDNPFLYRPVPLAVAGAFGVKWEQREQERFPALHGVGVLRWGILAVTAESYTKAELNFGQLQAANYLQAGVLVWPEVLFLAADIGHFWTSDFGELEKQVGYEVPGDLSAIPNALRRNRNEVHGRAALHWFFWRQNGVMSLRYAYATQDPTGIGAQRNRVDPIQTHEGVLQMQLRF